MKPLVILRLLAVLLIAFIAARPTAVRPEKTGARDWAVLVDTSASMRVNDPSERLATARALAAQVTKALGGHTQLFRFDVDASSITAAELPALRPEGKRSDLSKSLRTVFGQANLRGAVVLSDGRQVGGGGTVSAGAGGGKPLFLVGLGDASLFKDVAVTAVQGPPFAFKNIAASLTATVSVTGYPNQDIVVRLLESGRVVSVQTVRVPAAQADASVTFSWTPDSVGTKSLVVEAATYAGEASTVNNRRELTLDVGRDKFRVLYICGEPGPEYGFLRQQFKSDPAVELVTFVILRNAGNVLSVPEGELSLIPFPTQDVLINQIRTFDLVVFEEFSYNLYGLMPNVLYAVRERVKDGGSFLITGGPQAFGQGSPYAIPGISEMIPVNFGTADVSTVRGPLPLLPRIENHPILRLDPNPERNRDLWKRLPGLEDVTLVPSVKENAMVLGAVRRNDRDYPVFTVWRFGKGRVAAFTARTTWRWSLTAANDPQTSGVYAQFWKNVVLWLTRSDDFKPVRLALDGKSARAGENERLRVWVFDEYFKPVPDAEVQVQLTAADGATTALETHAETGGVYSAGFRPAATGAFEAVATATRNGRRLGVDRLRFRVVEGNDEDDDLRPDFDVLKGLADASNGRFVTAAAFTPEAVEELDRDIEHRAGRKVLLWNSPWVLGAVLTLLALEWFLRRRRGLP